MNSKPLQGVRVVDWSTYVAAPSAGRMLADWGADVIKIESMPPGEPWRLMGPALKFGTGDDENPMFDLANANKRSFSVNMKSTEGKGLVENLLSKADIFITNMRNDVIVKFGLTYETLSAKYPRLICAYVTGYGEKGPDAALPGFDSTSFWARSGAMIDLLWPDTPPMNVSSAMGDNTTGISLTAGICAALYKQKTTGLGEKVMVDLYGVAIWVVSQMMTMAQKGYDEKFPKLRNDPAVVCNHPYQCRDKEWILLTVGEYDRYWPVFCKILDREDLLNEEKYSTLRQARKHTKELYEIFEAGFLKKTRPEWIQILFENDVPFSKVNHFTDVLDDEQAWANKHLETVNYKNGAVRTVPCPPVQFSQMGKAYEKTGPALGADTKAILSEIGYTDAEINSFIENKIVFAK
jgi:crotonobetainyl-CoA:carnitine CoA-transferase CaiB-like acyl-CoA transferase